MNKTKYRNKNLTDSAKHESCVSCSADDGTIVWAHSNMQKHGKGMSTKAHDLFGCYLCHQCHSDFDRTSLEMFQKVYKMHKALWFNEMWERSMIIACNKGYL